MKIKIEVEDLGYYLWNDVPEEVRLEIIKSVVTSAPDAQDFCQKASKMLKKLEPNLD